MENKTIIFANKATPYQYIRDRELFTFFEKLPDMHKTIGLDIETYPRDAFRGQQDAGLLPAKTKIRLVQIYDGSMVYILDFMNYNGSYALLNPWLVEQLQNLLLSKTLVAHNALFETAHLQNLFLAHFGTYKPLLIRCTLNLFRLSLAAQTPDTLSFKASLDQVYLTIFDEPMPYDEQSSNWGALALLEPQIIYAGIDAIATRNLAYELLPYIQEFEMEEVFMLNTKAQEALTMMKLYGIAINEPEHKTQWEGWKVNRDSSALECFKLLNTHISNLNVQHVRDLLIAKVVKRFQEEFTEIIKSWVTEEAVKEIIPLQIFLEYLEAQESVELDEKGRRRALRRVIKNLIALFVNPNSGKQLSSWLIEHLPPEDRETWPLTKSGNALSTDSDAFADNAHIEAIGPISTYKKYDKLCSTYGEGLSKFFVRYPNKTVVYPNYSLCFTNTGRMSSFEPNLQNQPRDKEFRKLWCASGSDRRLLCADFSQIEIRVAAYLSQDPTMMRAYEEGLDIHAITAASMAGIPLEDVTEEQRQSAKAVNFGLLFGAGANTLMVYAKKAYKVLMSLDQAEDAVMVFRDTYQVYREWQIKQSTLAEKTGYVKTPLGKVRKLYPDNTYTVSMNTPVQGGAAEIMLYAMWYITQDLLESGIDAQLVNVVHDEVLVDSDENCIMDAARIIKRSMEKALLTVFPEATTRNLVDVGCGINWTEAKGKDGKLQIK